MKYVSTRGEAKEASFEDILASGTASDGGLFVPSVIPKLESAVIDDMKNLSYIETASILSLFQVVICFRCTSDIFPSGKNIKECKFSKF